MPPPASFITISSIPFSQLVTQAMFNVANEQWFKYTATIPIVLGMQTNKGNTFVPLTRVFGSDGTTLYSSISEISGHWIALQTIGNYYIQVKHAFGSTPTDFDFTFTADTRPLDIISLAEGDFIVNDDTDSLAAVVLSSTGDVKFFHSGIPAGEYGAILPSNVSFWFDPFGYHGSIAIAVFDMNSVYIGSVACGIISDSEKPAFGIDITNNKVYVVNGSRELWTISSAGIATNTGYIFPLTAGLPPNVIAINEDSTKLYWITSEFRVGTIHVLDLGILTPLSDLYTIPGFDIARDYMARTPNNHNGDMFVMPNGNIVTWWQTGSLPFFAPITYHLIVVSSTATLLYSYDYLYAVTQLNHLAYINEDSDHIMVWWYTGAGFDVGHFGRLALATGIIDQDFTIDLFSERVNTTGTDKFGPSSSCTFLRLSTIAIPDISGIYYINPTKTTRHDSYYNDVEKKIPDPTFRTGLFGE